MFGTLSVSCSLLETTSSPTRGERLSIAFECCNMLFTCTLAKIFISLQVDVRSTIIMLALAGTCSPTTDPTSTCSYCSPRRDPQRSRIPCMTCRCLVAVEHIVNPRNPIANTHAGEDPRLADLSLGTSQSTKRHSSPLTCVDKRPCSHKLRCNEVTL